MIFAEISGKSRKETVGCNKHDTNATKSMEPASLWTRYRMNRAIPPQSGTNASKAAAPRAAYFLPNCRTLRVVSGKTIADLSSAADVNASTIRKMEKLIPVTEVYARRVFNVLQKWNENRYLLDPNREVTTSNKKISFPSPVAAQRS